MKTTASLRLALGLLVTVSVSGAALAASTIPSGVIRNDGQFPGHDEVLFYAPLQNRLACFRSTGVDLFVRGRQEPVRITFPRRPERIEPVGEPLFSIHYFLGNDPDRWRSGVPVFEGVRYVNILPEVHIELTTKDGELAYEILSGHSPAFEDSLFVAESLRRTSPRLGRPQRSSAAGTSTTFDLDWSTLLGGWGNDRAAHDAWYFDADGTPLIIGYTQSSNFPQTGTVWDPTYNGDYDAYLAKLSETGDELVFLTFLGGSSEDRPFSANLDSAGNIVLAGTTTSSDLPTTDGAWDRTLGGTRDAWAAKFTPDGAELLWSTYLGGTGPNEYCWDVELDAQDRPVVLGRTGSSDYPTTPGAHQPSYAGQTDGFVTKLESNGADLVWSTYLGGALPDEAWDLNLDAQDRPVVAAVTSSSGLATADALYGSNAGQSDFLLAHLSEDGSELVYCTYFGGSDQEGWARMALGDTGRVLLTGFTRSTDFPVTPGAWSELHNGGIEDVPVALFDDFGKELEWSTFLGGNGLEHGQFIVFDQLGGAILSGRTQSTDFPVTADAFDSVPDPAGDYDGFVTRVSPNGSELFYSTYLGGPGTDYAWSLFLDDDNRLFVSGAASSNEFPVTAGAYDVTHNGGRDAFFMRFTVTDPDVSAVPGEPVATRQRLDVTPNPARGFSTVRYRLTEPGDVNLRIVDVSGRHVRTLVDAHRAAGEHAVAWRGVDDRSRLVDSGVLFLELRLNGTQVATTRLVHIE